MKFKLKQEKLNVSIQFIVSFIFILMGVWFYFDELKDKPQIDMFDWAYLIFFGVLFIVFLVKGIMGTVKYPFVQIDDQNITYLPDVNDFSTVLEWDNITKVEINQVAVIFHKEARQPLEIALNNFSEKSESELIDTIKELAKKKEIILVD